MLLGFIDSSIAVLAGAADALSDDCAAAEAGIEKLHVELLADIRLLKTLQSRTEDELYTLKRDIGNICSRWKTDEGQNLRNRMRELANNNITDGEMLNTAFSDYKKISFTVLTETIQERLSKFERVMEESYSDSADFSLSDGAFTDSGGFFRGEKGPRFRNLFDKAGAVAAGFAGLLFLTGPFGMIGGLLAGAVASVLGSFVGGLTKDKLGEKQRNLVLDQIPDLVDNFLVKTTGGVNSSISSYFDEVSTWITDKILALEEDASDRHRTGLANLKKSEAEKRDARKAVEGRIAILQSFRTETESASS
jgi:hypothetical protein